MKEFKVKVAPLIKKLELISRKGLSGFLSGGVHSTFKGRGLEFHGFRNYNPAEDDAKNIDWKTSLRSRHLLIKELVEERNNQVMFFVDVSSSMSFASVDLLKNEYVIELFASLAYSFIEGGDSVGLTIFNEKLISSIQPNIGTKQYYSLLKTLTNVENYEGQFHLEKCVHDFNAIMVRPSIIFIISDFIGLHGNWKKELKLLCAKHEVIIFCVNDPRDMYIPDNIGQVFVQDPFTNETLLIDTKIIKKDYEKFMEQKSVYLANVFKEIGAEYLFIKTNEPIAKTMISFFRQRHGR